MSVLNDIGKLFITVKPELHPGKEKPHLESIVLGSSILKSIGESLIKHTVKKGSGAISKNSESIGHDLLIKNLEHFSNKLPNRSGSGIKAKNIKNLLKKLDKRPVSAKDLFGSNWKNIGKKIMNKIENFHKSHSGGDIFKDIGKSINKTARDAKNELDQFWKGKTKLKPSQLAGYTAGSLGVLAGVATLQPELVGVSAGIISGIAGVSGGVAGILRTSGRGTDMPKTAVEFLRKYPEKAKIIASKLEDQKGTGLSKKTKAILSTVGALGLVGASSFLRYLSKGNTVPPNIQEQVFGKDFGDDWYSEELPFIDVIHDGSGIDWDEIKSFIKNNRKKALGILAGLAVTGLSVGGVLFKQKYGGIAPYSEDGIRILKHLLSGSEKKLEVGDLILKGKEIINLGSGLTPSGGKFQKHTPQLSGLGIHPAGYKKGKGLKPSGGSRSRKIGTKEDVWNGVCLKTRGGLMKKDLCINKRGKVVSKKQSENGKKRFVNLMKK